MTCKEFEFETLMAWVDEELASQEHDGVSAHLQTCGACQNEVAKIRAETAEIKLSLEPANAPSHLYEKTVMQWAPTAMSWLNWFNLERRGRSLAPLYTLVVLVASLAFWFQAPKFDQAGSVSVHQIASETIQDYRKFQASRRSLDVAGDDASETLAWLSERVETPFPNVTENIHDYRLEGGRLCLLLGQRLGALTYSKSERQVAVYIFPGAIDQITDLSELYEGGTASFVQSGVTSMVWEQHGLVVVLLSSEPSDELRKFASAFRLSMNGLEQQT